VASSETQISSKIQWQVHKFQTDIYQIDTTQAFLWGTQWLRHSRERGNKHKIVSSDYNMNMGWCPISGSLPFFQAFHYTSSVRSCISLQSSNYCVHCNVASGWVAYGILKLYHRLSLVTWETEGLSVLQMTSTCRAKLTWVIWHSHDWVAENSSHLGCDVLSSGM